MFSDRRDIPYSAESAKGEFAFDEYHLYHPTIRFILKGYSVP